MRVWIIEQGEQYEGGRIIEVIANPEIARARFLDIAHETFPGVTPTGSGEDGRILVNGDVDWLSLTAYPVTAAPEPDDCEGPYEPPPASKLPAWMASCLPPLGL